MGFVIDSEKRIVPTWLAAARYLQATGGTGRNLLLEVSQPGVLSRSDLPVLGRVNAQMVANGDLSIETVAGTIFPQGLYTRVGRPDFYQEYQRLMTRAQKPGTWGLYFDRITRREAPDRTTVNPLEDVIEKLKAVVARGVVYQATYELSPSDPAQDVVPSSDNGAELATYDPIRDRKRLYGGPCLSHLSFKITSSTILDLTAIYRSHRYCERALGNLIGLGRLQKFVAEQSELQLGALTCVSTHAELDLKNWGGVKAGRALLDSL